MAKRRLVLTSVLVGIACGALWTMGGHETASAAMDPAKVIQDRRDHMKEFGTDMKAINDFLQNGTGDAANVAKLATQISTYAKSIPDWFPAGTGEGDNVGKTNAKMEIWSDQAGFKMAADNLAQLSAKLAEVAATGDKGAIAAQFATTGKDGCGGCHSKFREKLQ